MTDLKLFTNAYPVSKTLRFELIPVGATASNIEKNGIIDADTRLTESYKEMKKTIDEFHKDFIDRALSHVTLSGLRDFYALYTAAPAVKAAPDYRKKIDAVKTHLRKEIVRFFKADPLFGKLDKKDLIQQELKTWIDANHPELYFCEDFRNFTTYFTGYNTNRMNMYSEEEKATAVSHRLIDENLPKFIDDILIFEKLCGTPVAEHFPALCRDMEAYLNVASLDQLFSLETYSDLLTQPQIEAFNTVIGGIKEGDRKLQGLNEYINLYNQTHPSAKLPMMKVLYKQILSDHVSASWLPEAFDDPVSLLDAVNQFHSDCEENHLWNELALLMTELPAADLGGIYIRNDASVSAISSRIFGSYSVLADALENYYLRVIDPEYAAKLAKAKTESARDKLEAAKERFVSKADYHSVKELQTALDLYAAEFDPTSDIVKKYAPDCLAAYFAGGISALISDMQERYLALQDTLNTAHGEAYKLTQTDKDLLHRYLDGVMEILHFVKPLYLKPGAELAKDEVFYGRFAPLYEDLQMITKLYDKVRNFVTQKPYSTEKIKLNFSCSTLLAGWDVNKETQNLGVLLRKDGRYYLGIMDKRANHVFEDIEPSDEADCYQKMQYKLLPGPNKMLPKVFFSKSRIDEFSPSSEILDIYGKESFKKGPAFDPADCRKLIDFYKASLEKHSEWNRFGFCFSDTAEYEDISGFYREVSEQGYQITYKNISSSLIDSLIADGKLYLFQIYNKDFSPNSKGKPNLHTMYWKALFDEKNLADVVYKLNGEAEVFYRKASIAPEERVIHPANQPLAAKNPQLAGHTSTFSYDLVKDRRYTVDKFQFHVPITMNFKAPGVQKFNEKVCAYIKNNPDVHIIGIDRGERHLLYISMIDRNGNVVKGRDGKYIQYSLNTITGEYRDAAGKSVVFSTPYHQLLDKREEERKAARENWGSVENIKELKCGYLSQVVHHIAKLMTEYNAIVVLEDLNSGFKNSRKKVEKQVYQNFEKALIEKLNYLVFKDVPADEPGGLYHALQLTAPFEGFGKLQKQSGFLFYIPAWNTSHIDPVTGFADLLKPKYKSVPDARDFFSRFDSITYNAEKDWFEFRFDYENFTDKAAGTKTDWTVCTHGALRYAFDRTKNKNRGGQIRWNVTEKMKELFLRNGVDYTSGDLIPAILCVESAGFYAALMKNLQITLSMRYSSREDGKDFILSPVADADGVFFSSEDAAAKGLPLPQDADANGAYNIARKGLYVLEQIDRAEDYSGWSTKISNKNWLNYVQTRFC